jgi:AGCS family alanine or glycine:cation symporter
VLYVIAAFLGCYALQLEHAAGFQAVWGFADVMNGAMAIPNLIGLLLLSGVVARETREFRAQRRAQTQ